MAARPDRDALESPKALLGALRFTVKTNGKTFTRHVEVGTGSGCQNDLTLHFGLGAEKGPVDVIVHWAGGGASTHQADVNKTVVIRKEIK